jgi:ArsR family transcriptional regulator
MKAIQISELCCSPITAAPLADAEAEEMARAFAAIADPVRLRLLGLIAAAEGGEACACNLVEPVGKSQPTVSHHLKILLEAGLVARDKRGTWMWYRVVPDRLEQLRAALAT